LIALNQLNTRFTKIHFKNQKADLEKFRSYRKIPNPFLSINNFFKGKSLPE